MYHRTVLLLLCSLQLFSITMGDHCCSIPRAQLEARARNPTSTSCPSDEYIKKLPLWCELCPDDFCRVGNKCFCASHFLDDDDLQNDCIRSFLVAWPASVGEEDIFRRICRSDLEPVSTNNTSCCSLTQDGLIKQRSTHVACPRKSPFSIKDKCHPCPPGTCRLGSECICPKEFESRHAECEDPFGVSWPDSVAKTDPDLQECESDPKQYPLPTLTPNFTISSQSCCSISEAEMDATLSSFSKNCPSHALTITLENECGSCPPEMCRVNDVCVCPQYFQQTTALKSACVDFFGATWPGSVSLEDRARRNCNVGSTSCCSFGEDALNEQIGKNKDCPSVSPFTLSNKCTFTCPEGMCRVKDDCYCIEDFIERLGNQCEEDFGEPWPSSVGKEDTRLKECASMESEESSSESGSSSETTVAPSVVASPDGLSSGPQPQSSFTESSPENESKLGGLEIAGTVAGVVSAILALLASGTGFFKWKKNQRAREAMGAAGTGMVENVDVDDEDDVETL